MHEQVNQGNTNSLPKEQPKTYIGQTAFEALAINVSKVAHDPNSFGSEWDDTDTEYNTTPDDGYQWDKDT